MNHILAYRSLQMFCNVDYSGWFVWVSPHNNSRLPNALTRPCSAVGNVSGTNVGICRLSD